MTVRGEGLAALFVLICISLTAVYGQTDIDFSFMLSKPEDNDAVEQDTSGVAPAVTLAVDAINDDITLLDGYLLRNENVLNSKVQYLSSESRKSYATFIYQ